MKIKSKHKTKQVVDQKITFNEKSLKFMFQHYATVLMWNAWNATYVCIAC